MSVPVIKVGDVDFTKLCDGRITKHNSTDFSVSVVYDQHPFIVETDLEYMVLGILKYSNPQTPEKINYSMSIAVPEQVDSKTGEFIHPFTKFLKNYEQMVKNYVPKCYKTQQPLINISQYMYESSIRPKKDDVKLDNHLRVKIHTVNNDALDFFYYDTNDDKVARSCMSYMDAKHIIRQGVRAKFQLEFPSMWFSTVYPKGPKNPKDSMNPKNKNPMNPKDKGPSKHKVNNLPYLVKKYGFSCRLVAMKIVPQGFSSSTTNATNSVNEIKTK